MTNDTHGSKHKGWIGVDLDGTLAVYHGWKGADHIGPPISAMVQRVRQWLDDGKEVRILTARVHPSKADVLLCRARIETWCIEVFSEKLTITHEKDTSMLELWDDRAVQVIPNSGARADSLRARMSVAFWRYAHNFLPRESPRAQAFRCQFNNHDYCDWEDPTPAHFFKAPCKRCGTVFSI